MRCDGCTSYEPWDNGVGRCHFLPPAGVRDARNDMWTPFPLVEPAWWCSQYQANPAVVAPGHTDLMVAPETIDAFMEANPLPPDNPPPLPMTPPATAFSATVADPEDDF